MHHILSLFNTVSCNLNALGSIFPKFAFRFLKILAFSLYSQQFVMQITRVIQQLCSLV